MTKTLQEIAKLEKKRLVLSDCIERAPQYKQELNKRISHPVEPSFPGGRPEVIPNYNEKQYVKKAKEKGTGLGQFRENCIVLGFALASSVIGLIVCWIPWLLAILSWPFSVFYTRKQAYKIYIEECQEKERYNNKLKASVESYNRQTIEYQKKLEEYNLESQRLPQRLAFVDKLTETMKVEREATEKILAGLYIAQNSSLSTRNFISTHALLHYIDSHQVSSVEEAHQLLDKEISDGKITFSINAVKRYTGFSEGTMKTVAGNIALCNGSVNLIYQELDRHLASNHFNADHVQFYNRVLPK